MRQILGRFSIIMVRYFINVQFTQKAAAYMEKGIKVDWSKSIVKILFQLLIDCSQVDHKTPFSKLNSITSYDFVLK